MASNRTTFADLPGRKLELMVVCQKCGHETVITGTEPKLQARPIAGQRFRCSVDTNGVRCGGIGLPTMRTRPDWTPPPRPPLPPIPRPPKLTPRAPGSRCAARREVIDHDILCFTFDTTKDATAFADAAAAAIGVARHFQGHD